jgi:hypothetical protein
LTSYRDLVNLIEHSALPNGFETPLVLDATGVGEVMYDLLRGSIHIWSPSRSQHGSATLHNGVIMSQRTPRSSALSPARRKSPLRSPPAVAQALYDEFRNFEVNPGQRLQSWRVQRRHS